MLGGCCVLVSDSIVLGSRGGLCLLRLLSNVVGSVGDGLHQLWRGTRVLLAYPYGL